MKMHFSHISIGGGVTGIETVISAFNKIEKELKKSKKTCKKLKFKNFFFAIIDKNPKNIPGGVAYGFDISRFGYFNNPIRLEVTWDGDAVDMVRCKYIIKAYEKYSVKKNVRTK